MATGTSCFDPRRCWGLLRLPRAEPAAPAGRATARLGKVCPSPPRSGGARGSPPFAHTLPAERLAEEGWTLTVSRAGARNPWAMPEVLPAGFGGKVEQAQTTRPSISQHQTEPRLD